MIEYARLDKRTGEGQYVLAVEAAMIDDLGGDPSTAQLILIRRASIKALRCDMLDRFILSGEASPDVEQWYLRWSNTLRKDLQALGLKRVSTAPVSLEDYLKAERTVKQARELERKTVIDT